MSGSGAEIDLAGLARAPQPAQVPRPRRRWVFALVPIVLLLGFGLVFLDSAWGLFSATLPVTVVRPLPAEGTNTATGSVVLQTAGWIEPDPFRVRVTALTTGVVETMLVRESDVVKAGDAICKLIAADAELAVAAATSALAHARAEHRAAGVELDNAKASFTAALEVTEARSLARADSKSRGAELERRRAAAREASASVEVAHKELETQRFLRREGAAGPWQVELAEARVAEARARQSSLAAEVLRATAEVDRSQARLVRADQDFELRLGEHLRINTGEAAVARTEAAVQAAAVVLREAQLRLARMTVKSPMAGVVLSRDADQGSVVGPTAAATPVCHLYDPKSLRVRVDVPQDQVAPVSVDMLAEIRCNARRGQPYAGRVIRIVDQADIQKVTLEVQVRVLDPDGLLKPDMLCQVSVLGAATTDAAEGSAAMRIPARCLAGGDSVWVIDGASGRAARRSLRLGQHDGNEVIVLDGLNATDKVIDRVIDSDKSALSEGARVRIEAAQ